MFTGIITAVGRITSVTPAGEGETTGMRLHIDAGTLPMEDVMPGDSIALSGACMTVVEKIPVGFAVDISRESLNRTTGLDRPGDINLEKALQMGDRLGGHLVAGHVDGIGTVSRFDPVGESFELVIEAPKDMAGYFAYKGSVAVDGVSLTVNRVEDTADGCLFSINLIPHTIEVTTLKNLVPGKKVNLEVDLIARYVERMLSLQDSQAQSSP